MSDRLWQIGICGTFDVENYGDLLFPLVAESELRRRLGRVQLEVFSYHAKDARAWPFAVRALTALPAMAARLDGLLVGGGDLIRFDKRVAPGYGPPTPGLHHPTGYWLTPMLIAAQHGCPIIWNAPGAHGAVPAWAEPLMELVLSQSRYVAVRDAASREALNRFAPQTEIHVVPDTAFGVRALLHDPLPTSAYLRLRETLGLRGPYLIVQAQAASMPLVRCLANHAQAFRGYQIVVVPIGPRLGDRAAAFSQALPEGIALADWPDPLLLAELIAHAAGVIGVSLHLAITALVWGVPVFHPAQKFGGKYAVLRGFDTVFPFDDKADHDPRWLVERLQPATVSPAAHAAVDELTTHWDNVAAALAAGPVPATQERLGQYWQALPGQLEAAAEQSAADLAEREAAWGARYQAVRAERDALLASTSWKITAPLRALGQKLGWRLFRRR